MSDYDRFKRDMRGVENCLGRVILLILAPMFALIPAAIVTLPIADFLDSVMYNGSNQFFFIPWIISTIILWVLVWKM